MLDQRQARDPFAYERRTCFPSDKAGPLATDRPSRRVPKPGSTRYRPSRVQALLLLPWPHRSRRDRERCSPGIRAGPELSALEAACRPSSQGGAAGALAPARWARFPSPTRGPAGMAHAPPVPVQQDGEPLRRAGPGSRSQSTRFPADLPARDPVNAIRKAGRRRRPCCSGRAGRLRGQRSRSPGLPEWASGRPRTGPAMPRICRDAHGPSPVPPHRGKERGCTRPPTATQADSRSTTRDRKPNQGERRSGQIPHRP